MTFKQIHVHDIILIKDDFAICIPKTQTDRHVF